MEIAQTQTQAQPQELAKKLLTGEALNPQEAAALTNEEIAREVAHFLWHYSFWGW
jgi:hypothetical protein